MPMAESAVKAVVNAAMPTVATLQANIWNNLFALGMREHNIPFINPLTGNPFPDLHDVTNVIALHIHAQIKTVMESTVDEIIKEIRLKADVTATTIPHAIGASTQAIGLGPAQGVT